ncbi:MAG: hypothetical protein ABS81_15775 [Pseudonocardia sp. SCN 72-86]|mgnify:CR=1 FL=1|nr:MAG: hypothetical protein ABS81_15775 [Pseudonocardia sp. SCN 72-86]
MRARARLIVELGEYGRSVVREIRSQTPLALVPRRGVTGSFDPTVTVHLVGSASTPLAGDDIELDVRVEPGAALVLTGVAAAVALPGAGRSSSFTIRAEVGDGASLQYLPEPTVVTARADHRTLLDVTVQPGARLRCRDVLVAGRSGEPSGRYSGTTRIVDQGVVDDRRVLLHQTQQLGDGCLMASPAHLAGHRVLGTEVLVWGEDTADGAAGERWALSPLPGRGSLAIAVGSDAVSTGRALSEAAAAHVGWRRHASPTR